MLFLILALVLGLLTVGGLMVGLMRAVPASRQRADTSREIAIYRDQLREIDRDRARGVITGEEEAAARLEIERRLIAAGKRGDAAAGQRDSRAISLGALVLIGLVPLVASLLYLSLGEPGAVSNRADGAQARAILDRIGAAGGNQDEAIRELTIRLQQDMDDPADWLALGRALYAEGRLAQAIPAYETAVRLTGSEDAAIFSEYTLVTIDALNARLEENPGDLAAWRQLADIRMTLGEIDAAQAAYEEVLRLDPDDAQARAALGIDAFMQQ